MAGGRALMLFVMVCSIRINFSLTSSPHETYNRHCLVRVTPVSASQLEYVQSLASVAKNLTIGVDFWLTTTVVNNSADILIPPNIKNFLLKNLGNRSIPYKILVEDIGKVVQKQSRYRQEEKTDFFARYRNLDEIYKYISDLVQKHELIASLIDYGKSSEDVPLLLVKIASTENCNKPAIWIQGGAHAREHISPAAVLYMITQLLTEFDQCCDTKGMVEAFDWYLVPVANPDGYKYSWKKNRLWRKTRSFNRENPDCFGVDFNRNWGFQWNHSEGSSNNPCSHTYAGSAPFSEPETQSVSNYLLSLRGRLLMFLDFHSYSQKWLTPWGYTNELPPNYKAQIELAEIATEALRQVHGTKYTIGSTAGILYTVSGGARDWAYAVAGAKYSYTVELRDDGTFGFLLPDSEIFPTVNETWIGLKAMALALRNLTISNDFYNTPREPGLYR